MSPFLLVSISIFGAAVFAFIASLFKQPLLIGYILAGIILSALGFFSDTNKDLLENMGHLGIAFLLFLVGIEMNLKEIKSFGRASLITGLGQMAFTIGIGLFVVLLLGYKFIPGLYLAIALAFSSTVIIVKLLSEKRDLNSLYGRISIGFLLVQDFAAILLLVFLAGLQKGAVDTSDFLILFGKGALLFLGVYILSKTVLPKIFDRVALASQELLFIASIAWALILSSFVALPQIGFSIEIGGFLAGLALANSTEHLQIASRVKPLRDFFLPIFFLVLGAKMIAGLDLGVLFEAVVLSLIVLIGNPLIVLVLMSLLGYKSRTSFLASVTVAQISEFSFIVAIMGAQLGHITNREVSLVALVGVITMTISTYLMLYGHVIYHTWRGILKKFERKKTKESAFLSQQEFVGHTILIGLGRTGRALLPVLKKREESLLIVDFDPEVVSRACAEGCSAMYGDVADSEALESLNLTSAKYLISTTNSLQDNLILLERVKRFAKKPLVVMTAGLPGEALKLYEHGADYVVVPRIVSGEYLGDLFSDGLIDKAKLTRLRTRHFERLAKERFGHL